VGQRDKVTGEWRKLHNEGFNDLYSTQNIIWVIKLRRMRWEGHIPYLGERRAVTGFWSVNLKEETTWKSQVYMGG
jgi:hypothetical protein